MGGYAARCRGVCCVGRFRFVALISLLLSNNLLANDTDVFGIDAGVQLQKSVTQVVAPGDDPGSIGSDIPFVEKPVLGLAKSAGDSIWLGDHRFRVTIVLLASNSGGQKAKDINIFDDLADTFAASTAFHVVPGSVSSDVFNTNPNFNGRSDTALLTAGNTLSAGAQGSVVFSVEYEAPDTEGVFTNIAKLVSNDAAFDLSTDGSTPDPDGDGRPDEQVPTSITYTVPPPLLGLAKAVSGISQVENNTFIVDFELNVENFGAGPAHEINLQDNLATAFNSALRFQVVTGSLRSAGFTVDETFDGMTQQRLLLGGNSLAAGATGTVYFSVEFEVGEGTEDLANSAVVVSQGGLPDDSVSGTDPDPNGDDLPTEKGSTQIEAEFTAPLISQVGLAKAVLQLTRDGPEVAVQVQLVAVNLGDVDLHDVQITDDLNLTFPADVAFEVVPGSLQSSDLGVNQSFDGDLDTRLLSAGVTLPAGSRAVVSFELEFIPLLERGTFFNTARVITGDGLEDDSTSGDNPDPDGDGRPDEAEPTAISYVRPEPAAALLGVAKAVAEPVFLDTGRYQVRYLLTIENFGATTARDVRLIDNLVEITSALSDVAVVPGSLMSSELIVNPDFDGLTNVDLLIADTELAAGQLARAEFLIEFSPPDETTRLANTAIVTARDIPPDDSVPGTDPDPDGDGVPDESGVTEQDIEPRPEPEAEKFAVLGLAKSATTATYQDEHFVSTISFTVENLGNKALTELQVTDSLADVFPEGVGFSVVNGSLNSPTLAINPNFDGVGDQDLLLGSDELEAGAIAQLQFDLAISPNDNPGPFRNTAIAIAAEGLRDVSTDGTDPDPDNDDKPDEDQQSLINLDVAPALLLRKIVNTVEQTQQGFTVAFELLVENTGNVPLSELQLTDDLQSFAADVSALQVVAPPSASGAVSQVNSDFSLGDPRLLSGSETLPVGAQVRIMFELAFAAVATSQALINRAQVDASAPDGRVVQERAEVEVNLPGGIAGIVYLDENHNGELDETEPAESNYLVQLLDPEGRIIATASVDDEGRYRFVELPAGEYELRYRQQDSEVVWGSRSVSSVMGSVSVVNLPVSPQGVVYDSNVRAPLAGVQVGLADGAGQLLPASCLLPGQQNQVTDNSGRYVFSIQHGAASSCPTAAQNYQLVITAVPQGYLNGLSRRLPPETGVFDLSQCGSPCLLQPQNEAPAEGLDTRYIENFRSASSDPVLINNHLPIDRPTASGGPTSAGLEINVSASRRTVSPGGVVGYVISITNTSVVPATNTQLTDRLAPAVSRVGDTATLVRPGEDGVFGTGDDLRLEWAVSGDRESVFAPFDMVALSEVRIEFVGRVSANARPGPQENRSAATAAFPRGLESVFDTAVVNVTADVLMDKATLIGKVFLDLNRNGVQDHKDENGELLASPERGLAGVRLITPEGLVVETDQHGRYHIADIAVTRSMGINYVIKIDSLSLPEKATVLNDLRQVARLMPGDIGKVNYAIDIPGAVEECCPKFNPLTSFDPFRPEKKLDIWVASVGARQSNVVPVQFGVSSNYFASLGSGVITLIAKQPLGETSIDSACFEFTSDRRRISLQKKLDLRISPGRYEYRLKVFAENVCSEPESTWQTFASDKTAAQMLDLNVMKPLDMGMPVAGRDLIESSGIILPAANRRLSHHRKQLLVEALVTDSVSFLQSHALDWRAVEIEDRPANPTRPIYEDSTLEVNYNWRGVYDSPASTRVPSVTLERGLATDIDKVKYSAQGTKVEMTCCGVLTYASTFIDDNNSVTTLRLSNRSDATDLDVCVMKKSERALPDILGSCLFEQVLRAGTTNELFLGVFDNGPESTGYWEELRVQLQDPAGRKFYYDVRRTRASEDGVLRPPRITAECFDLRATPQTTEERGVASINLTREAAAVPLSEQNYGVGVLDLTFGHNQRSGDLDSAFIDEQFDRGSYGDGRIAAYWRGVKPMGERDLSWVFQVDSTKDELSNFTDNLQRENPDRIFRQLDGDLYYPTYGDDSTTLLDTNSQGAFYARLNYASSHALWGNYNSQLNTSEFSHYNRSLYGFQTHIESEKQNSSGAALHALKLFASQAQSTSAHAEFGATGGSLYYLRHTDIVMGSEKVWIEVRRQNSQQVEEREILVPGRDYEIDPLQGRILLRRPLSQIMQNRWQSVVQSLPLDGDRVFLLVDYEYVPTDFAGDDLLFGGRLEATPVDKLRFGLTHVTEQHDRGDHQLDGLDVQLNWAENSYVSLEYVRTENISQASGIRSFNGGLTFDSTSLTAPVADVNGEALGFESYIDLADVNLNDGLIRLWWKQRGAGFNTGRYSLGPEVTDSGFDFETRLNALWTVSGGFGELEQQGISRSQRVRTQVSYKKPLDTDSDLFRYFDIEGVYEDSDYVAQQDLLFEPVIGQANLLGLRFGQDLDARNTVYGTLQKALSASDDYYDNDRVAVGLNNKASERLSLAFEGSTGDRGHALTGGVNFSIDERASVNLSSGVGSGALTQFSSSYQLAEGSEVYGSYRVNPDRNDAQRNMMTFGQRRDLGSRTRIFTESQFGKDTRQASTGHVLGLEYDAAQDWTISSTLQKSLVERNQGDYRRTAVSLGTTFQSEVTRFSARSEVRNDEGSNTDLSQYLVSAALTRVIDENRRVMTKLNVSWLEDRESSQELGRFVEFDLGYAFRPALSDRLNMLARYAYLFDVGTQGQSDAPGDERSHILATEGLFEMTQRIRLGGKLAYRSGETRLNKGEGDWFDVEAALAVMRFEYQIVIPKDKKWQFYFPDEFELIAQYRWLKDLSGDGQQQGALLGVYKQIDGRRINLGPILAPSLRVGVGYNFSGFDDDMRSTTFKSHGWFVDMMALF